MSFERLLRAFDCTATIVLAFGPPLPLSPSREAFTLCLGAYFGEPRVAFVQKTSMACRAVIGSTLSMWIFF